MAKVDLSSIPESSGSGYPRPFDAPCTGRRWQSIADAAGFTTLGASRCVLAPGAWSSQRHWHTKEEELVVMLEGEMVLVTDKGEELLRPGDFAVFKANDRDGHHAQNRSEKDAVFLAISAIQSDDGGEYSDIDLKFENDPATNRSAYFHKDGTPY